MNLNDKCVGTHMTIAEYLHSLDHVCNHMPELQRDWPDLEDVLVEEYNSQIEWVVNTAVDVYQAYPEIRQKVRSYVHNIYIQLLGDDIMAGFEWDPVLSAMDIQF